MKIPFTCKRCGKTIHVTEEIHDSHYKGKDECLSCRK